MAWASYDRRCLRELREETAAAHLWHGGRAPAAHCRKSRPCWWATGDWTRAALGASEHMAQVYHKLRRRHNAVRARYLLREELRRFVTWDGSAEEAQP